MYPRTASPASATAHVPDAPSRIALSSGLPDRYRIPFVLFFAVASFGVLAVIIYKMHTTGPVNDHEAGPPLDGPETRDGDGGHPTLDWLSSVTNTPEMYAILLSFSFGTGLVLTVVDLFTGVAGAMFFAGVLFGIKAFLRFGWPYVERFYERRQPDERDPNSLRFQGFSTDLLIFLTLFAVTIIGMLVLVLVEAVVG